MRYTSVNQDTWRAIKSGRRLRGDIPRPNAEEFIRVFDAFHQAEYCPESDSASSHVRRYRAEYNIWIYYFGEDGNFPGLDPAIFKAESATPPGSAMSTTDRENASFGSESTHFVGRFGLSSPERRAVEAGADAVSNHITNKPGEPHRFESNLFQSYEGREFAYHHLQPMPPSRPSLLSPARFTTVRRVSNTSTLSPRLEDRYQSSLTQAERDSSIHERKRGYRSPSGYRFMEIDPPVVRRSASPPTSSRGQLNAVTSSSRTEIHPLMDFESTHLPDSVQDAMLVGKHPHPESGTSVFTFTEEGAAMGPSAWLMRRHLENKWKTREAFENYQPQLGFNPITGEPWLSIRCYAEDAYPSLSGQRHRYLLSLKKKIPKFEIEYERFEKEKDWGQKYLLIWPEFKDPKDMGDDRLWMEFGELRAFLESWAREENPEPIFKAYAKWLEFPKHIRRGLELPEDFPIEDFQNAGLRDNIEREYHGRKNMKPRREGSRETDRECRFGGHVRERSRSPDYSRRIDRRSRDEWSRGRYCSRSRERGWEVDRYRGDGTRRSGRDRSQEMGREGRHGRDRSRVSRVRHYGHDELRSGRRYRGGEQDDSSESNRASEYTRGREQRGGSVRDRSNLHRPHYYGACKQDLDQSYLRRERQIGARQRDAYRPRY